VSGERKIPPSTMNATKDGAKDQQEQEVQVLGILMPWGVEHGDMCSLSREGSSGCPHYVADSEKETKGKSGDEEKGDRNNENREDNRESKNNGKNLDTPGPIRLELGVQPPTNPVRVFDQVH